MVNEFLSRVISPNVVREEAEKSVEKGRGMGVSLLARNSKTSPCCFKAREYEAWLETREMARGLCLQIPNLLTARSARCTLEEGESRDCQQSRATNTVRVAISCWFATPITKLQKDGSKKKERGRCGGGRRIFAICVLTYAGF